MTQHEQSLVAENAALREQLEALKTGKCLHQIQEPVAGQCRFKGHEWGACHPEHVAIVLSNPHEWPDYEVRHLYAAPVLKAQPDIVTGPCGQCKDNRQPCFCAINTMLAERGSVAVNREHYLKISKLAKAPQAAPAAVAVPDERAEFEAWASFVGYSIKKWQADAKLYEENGTENAWIAWQARAALAATPAVMKRTCGVCGADEAFTGTCGGGRANPTALCFEGSVAAAIPAAAAPVVLPEQHEDDDKTTREVYRRMFIEACGDLGLINEALDLDPDDGGAEPILAAIQELKSNKPAVLPEPVYQISRPFPADPAHTWRDAAKEVYDLSLPTKRRILYTERALLATSGAESVTSGAVGGQAQAV